MAANLSIKMIAPDSGNFTFEYIIGTGTTMQVPRSDDHGTVRMLSERIIDGRIDLSNVNDPAIRTEFLRLVVEHQMHQNTPRNGQRPPEVVIELVPRVAHLAAGITDVRRDQIRYRTIGAVESETQYNDGMTALLRAVGRDSLRHIHGLLYEFHVICTNGGDVNQQARDAARLALVACARSLRDALCTQFGLPGSYLNELHQLQTDTNRNNGIINDLQQQITAIQHELTDIRANHDYFQKQKKRRCQHDY